MSTHPLIQNKEDVERVRRALDGYQAAGDQWVFATLKLAEELWRARQKHASDNAFGQWLTENKLDVLKKDERSALIGMGKNGIESKRVLETTSRRSVRHIWLEEIRPQIEAVSPRGETRPERASKPETPNTGVESEEEAIAREQVRHLRKIEAILKQLKTKESKYHLKMSGLSAVPIIVDLNGAATWKFIPYQRKTITISRRDVM